MPESSVDGGLVFFDSLSVLNDVADGEVGGNENAGASELRGLVLLVDGEAGFITDRLDEIDGEPFHCFMIQIFKHNMRMFAGIV